MKRASRLAAPLAVALLLPCTLPAQRNTNLATSSAIASGLSNTIARGANYSFIGSGWRNLIKTNGPGPNGMSFIGGGQSNTVGANWSVINGGLLNRISPGDTNGQMSFIGSGNQNLVLAKYAVIAGGYSNTIQPGGSGGSIGGGYENEVSGLRGTVPGGTYNEAAGANSFAAGSYAASIHPGAFVWSDTSSAAEFVSTGSNQFLIRAQGGVAVNTNNPGSNALLVNGAAKIVGDLSVGTINGQTNFAGPPGPQGEQGPQGPAGPAGSPGTPGAPGSPGSPGSPGTPGLNGTNGAPGLAATVSVGTVTNGAAGSLPQVINAGTSNAAILNFTIPQGLPGNDGPTGAQGPPGTAGPAGQTGPEGPQGIPGVPGLPGAPGLNGTNGTPGLAATVSVGTVSNGLPLSMPVVSNSGTSNAAIFNFTFPLVLPAGGAGIGTNNTAPGIHAVVGGGEMNTAGGDYATVPGGQSNAATNYAFAAGRRAQATNDGAFVWADSKDLDFGSTAKDQFLIRAGGGVGINTNDPGTNALSVNGTVQIGTIQVLTGIGEPTMEAPNGSLYLNAEGAGPSDTLWFRAGGEWHAVYGSPPPTAF